jgi:hypothetical protein
MKSVREVEDAVRRHQWPLPSAQLRSRILSDAVVSDPPRRVERTELPVFGAPSRSRLHLAATLVISIVVMLGGCTGADLWADRQVEAEITRLERRYGSLDKATMQVPAVPASENRAEVARAAAALMVEPTSAEWRALYEARKASTVPSALGAFIQSSDAAVRAAHGISERRQSNWGVDYEHDGERPAYLQIRTLSDAIWVSALTDIEAGRADDAATKTASGLALAASLRQEPDLLAQLIRLSVFNSQISGLRGLIMNTEPSRVVLGELAARLAESRGGDPMRVGLLGELKQAHAVFTRMERGDIDGRLFRNLYPASWLQLPESWAVPLVRIGRPIVRLAHARYLGRMADLIASQTGPRPRAALPEPEPAQRWNVANRLVDKFISGIERSIETGDDYFSALGLAELAVALRRYRLDGGAYPDDLAALVPRYLPSLPNDPYTGRRPEYARSAAGFTLRAARDGSATSDWWQLEWNVPR